MNARERRHAARRLARRADQTVTRAAANVVRRIPELELRRAGEPLAAGSLQGLKVYWCTLGGTIDCCTVRTDTYTADRDIVGFHVVDDEEHLDDRQRWHALALLAADRLADEITGRVAALQRVAPAGWTARFALWPPTTVRAWFDDDSERYHVLARMPVAGLTVPRPHADGWLPVRALSRGRAR